MSKPSLSALVFGTMVALGLGSSPSATAAVFACDDESGLCVDSGGASFTADKKTSKKNRKKRSTKSAGSLSLTIDNGRGSVFINGRYIGTAPISGVEIPSGRNDLQVRDGAAVLASGELNVPKNADVSLTVRHE